MFLVKLVARIRCVFPSRSRFTQFDSVSFLHVDETLSRDVGLPLFFSSVARSGTLMPRGSNSRTVLTTFFWNDVRRSTSGVSGVSTLPIAFSTNLAFIFGTPLYFFGRF